MSGFKRVLLVADCFEEIKGDRKFDHIGGSDVEQICAEVVRAGYDCDYFGGVNSLVRAYETGGTYPDDVLFMNLTTGLHHEGRKLQAPVLLEMIGARYTGSDPFAHALANNKHYSKLAVSEICEICTVPRGIIVSNRRGMRQLEGFDLLPAVVKPNNEGSSIGIESNHPCRTKNEVIECCKTTVKQFGEAVVEEYVPGADATCFVLGNSGDFELLHPVLYEINGELHQEDFVRGITAKYPTSAITRKIALSRRNSYGDLCGRMQRAAIEAFQAIGCRDIARIDFRIRQDGSIVFLEINALPMLEPGYGSWMALDQVGLTFVDFARRFVTAAEKRYFPSRGQC